MELLSIGDKTCVLGCRWKTATSMAKLGKDSWLESWKSDCYVVIANESKRFSLGVIEQSATDEFQISKRKLYSLAGIVNTEIKNGVALFEIRDSYDEVRYWVSIFNNGVPEMDFSSKDLHGLLKILERRLSDSIDNLLGVPNPILMTNLDGIVDNVQFKSLLAMRDFNVVPRGYQELHLMAESAKLGLMKVDGSFLSAHFLSDISAQKKKDIIYYSVALLLIVSGAVFFLSGNNNDIDDYIPETTLRPTIVKPVNKVNIEEVRLKVESTLADYLIGANLGLFEKMYSRYRNVTSFAFGYNRRSITCALALGRCEVEYTAGTSYKEFNKAVYKLKSSYDDVVFDIKGEKLTGIWKISPNDIYRKSHKISDLPINDRGEGLIDNTLRLTTTRPGLVVSISGAARVSANLDKFDMKEIPKEVQTSFIQLAWNAKGVGHQSILVLETMRRDFMTLNHFSITTLSGIDNFDMTGAYIMREIPNE